MAEYVFIKNNAYKVSQRIGGSVIQCRSCNGKSAEDRKKKPYTYISVYVQHAYICASPHFSVEFRQNET